MKPFRWSSEKNNTVKAERGISFENIVVSIEAGGLLDILAHPSQAKYPRQRVLVVACDNSVLTYFSCVDCAVEAARVVAAGGKVQKEKISIGQYGFIALAIDTEGNMFGLHSMQ
jgi:uncharacterized DUF497 family protein